MSSVDLLRAISKEFGEDVSRAYGDKVRTDQKEGVLDVELLSEAVAVVATRTGDFETVELTSECDF